VISRFAEYFPAAVAYAELNAAARIKSALVGAEGSDDLVGSYYGWVTKPEKWIAVDTGEIRRMTYF
jgi:hypothetical protein